MKARQRLPDQLGRPSGTQSVGYKRPSRVETSIALDPRCAPNTLWNAAVGSGDSRQRAVCVWWDCMMRVERDKIVCGRPVAVPDRSRRSPAAEPWMEFETDSLGKIKAPATALGAPGALGKLLAAGLHQISRESGERGSVGASEPPTRLNLRPCHRRRRAP